MFKAEEYQKRREVLQRLMGKDSFAVFLASPPVRRNGDVHYPYRQGSDFLYLTGFDEPDAALIVTGYPGKSYMFSKISEPKDRLWHGERPSLEEIKRESGADEVFPWDEFGPHMAKFLFGNEKVFYAVDHNAFGDDRVLHFIRRAKEDGKNKEGKLASKFEDVTPILADMRLFKSKEEVEVMARAAEISAEAHREAMKVCRPGMMEYELEEVLTSYFRKNGGSPNHAYQPIVAGGANATTLHWVKNNSRLRDGDLVLVDAGCEIDGYASDITRTYPANGKFTKPQKKIYNIVLAAEKAAIQEARRGNTFSSPHVAAVHVITEGLLSLGILRGKLPKLVKEGLADEGITKSYRPWFPHRTGHWLGLDVHDAGTYKENDEWRVLFPGMVMTVEPGLYFPPGDTRVPREFWNIGIRIEDDVLVTAGEPRVLSEKAPKETAEIEALMAH